MMKAVQPIPTTHPLDECVSSNTTLRSIMRTLVHHGLCHRRAPVRAAAVQAVERLLMLDNAWLWDTAVWHDDCRTVLFMVGVFCCCT